jgi:hypothetical protein
MLWRRRPSGSIQLVSRREMRSHTCRIAKVSRRGGNTSVSALSGQDRDALLASTGGQTAMMDDADQRSTAHSVE